MSAPESEVIKKTLEDATTYPILTHEIDPGFAAERVDITGRAGGSLNQVAQLTIRRLLGWRHRDGDARGFTAALGKAFTLKEVEGHTEWEWKPQTFTVQADLGEITGAQASIHNQATLILEQAVKLLDGLVPLKPDADPEDAEAIRSIMRGEFLALQEELGLKGGPRVERVDLIFRQLFTDKPNPDPFRTEGQLGLLRHRFGLREGRVNTIDEELNLTNFIILVDSTFTLHQTWLAKRDQFRRHQSPFLGTQLVHLSQVLEVIVEDVQETYSTMDSVLFGATEREAEAIALDDKTEMTVAELLGWVETFAESDGPELLRASGKDGATAFWEASLLLQTLVGKLIGATNLPDPLTTGRVKRALKSLKRHLDEATKLSEKVKRPQADHNGHGPHPSLPGGRKRWMEYLERKAGHESPLAWMSRHGGAPVLVDQGKKAVAQVPIQMECDAVAAAALIRGEDLVADHKKLYANKPVQKQHVAEFDLSAATPGPFHLVYIADGTAHIVENAVVIDRRKH